MTTTSIAKVVDSGPPMVEDYERFLLDRLFSFHPGPYAMLYAYLDESGTEPNSPTLCVASVLYDQEGAKSLDAAWEAELSSAGIQQFHTVDCAHRRGEFEGKTPEFCDVLYRKLVALVVKHTCGSAVAFRIAKEEFNPFLGREWGFGPYSACAYACMGLIVQIARRLGHQAVDFTIEMGHLDLNELRNLIEKRRSVDGWRGMESYQFRDKSFRLLSTADVFAYECSKRIKDFDVRDARKSLLALINGENREAVLLDVNVLQQISKLVKFKPPHTSGSESSSAAP